MAPSPRVLRLGVVLSSALALLFVVLALALPNGFFTGSMPENLMGDAGGKQGMEELQALGISLKVEGTAEASLWTANAKVTTSMEMPAALKKQLVGMNFSMPALPKIEFSYSFASDDCSSRKSLMIGAQTCTILALLCVVAGLASTALAQWRCVCTDRPPLFALLSKAAKASHGLGALLALLAAVFLLAAFYADFGKDCMVTPHLGLTEGLPQDAAQGFNKVPMGKIADDGRSMGAAPFLLLVVALQQAASAVLHFVFSLEATDEAAAAELSGELLDAEDISDDAAEMPTAINAA